MVIDAEISKKFFKIHRVTGKLFGARFTARAAELVVSVCASPCVAFTNVVLDVAERLIGVSLEVGLRALRADWIP